jgi:glutamine synthetase
MHDPARMSDAERVRAGIRPLPGTLREALEALRADAVLFPALGELLGRALIEIRTAEADALDAMSPDAARLAHMRVF